MKLIFNLTCAIDSYLPFKIPYFCILDLKSCHQSVYNKIILERYPNFEQM